MRLALANSSIPPPKLMYKTECTKNYRGGGIVYTLLAVGIIAQVSPNIFFNFRLLSVAGEGLRTIALSLVTKRNRLGKGLPSTVPPRHSGSTISFTSIALAASNQVPTARRVRIPPLLLTPINCVLLPNSLIPTSMCPRLCCFPLYLELTARETSPGV